MKKPLKTKGNNAVLYLFILWLACCLMGHYFFKGAIGNKMAQISFLALLTGMAGWGFINPDYFFAYFDGTFNSKAYPRGEKEDLLGFSLQTWRNIVRIVALLFMVVMLLAVISILKSNQ